jgi:hypothetical protein
VVDLALTCDLRLARRRGSMLAVIMGEASTAIEAAARRLHTPDRTR